MKLQTYINAVEFLDRVRDDLEANESANNLMLGLAARLRKDPLRYGSAPYFAVVEDKDTLALAGIMTPPHNLIIYSVYDDIRQPAKFMANDLRANNWKVNGVGGPTDLAQIFVEVWTGITGQLSQIAMKQRIYELRLVIPPTGIPGHLRKATEADFDLVSEWSYGFTKDAFGEANRQEAQVSARRVIDDGGLYIWEDGVSVSMASAARGTAHGISISYVYTPPDYRRRGYASACVAALSQLQLDAGRQFCCLFTDLANPTSNSIYQKIGYQPVCDYNVYKFV